MSAPLVIDSSAWVAIVLEESDARWFEEALAGAREPVMSAGTLQEVITVLGKRSKADHVNALDFAAFVTKTALAQGIRIVPVDAALASLGAAASLRFQSRPASLNFGDGFAYALAMSMNGTILCKGQNFIHTNVAVLRPPTND